MDETARLGLPLLQPAQAQKHVTMNEALLLLDGMVQLVLLGVNVDTPPGLPTEGDCYGIGPAPVSAWSGQAGMIALFVSGGWVFVTPKTGFRAWVATDDAQALFDGSNWVSGAVTLSPNGAGMIFEVIEFDHVLSVGATSEETLVIPANSVVYGVTGRVTSVVSGALTSFRIGVTGADNRYGSGIGLAANSWLRGLTGAPLTYYSNTGILFTGEGGDFAAGTVRIALHLARFSLPAL